LLARAVGGGDDDNDLPWLRLDVGDLAAAEALVVVVAGDAPLDAVGVEGEAECVKITVAAGPAFALHTSPTSNWLQGGRGAVNWMWLCAVLSSERPSTRTSI
jgi:hypothetical protein